ncbi:uncharacterized protein MONOS_14182 [Monocercomonoides exilis]|uniref:uncharacterized protein n=1 Tax=Monocercomonoides exilis TaxID=2049356 RepID=UPI0035599925|nr:hypothetical protein MONOS_14182 [Monocercomonoides exilis]|eukprot:MONOS_14182.1-p1 / transcript=MONOS_14182.1 / gene=MONOS_14182 / organism=Monocercomonoides_exilis_PA203 / gene_product=unspecified product / transcript_product=unspecified product / location=Mono_scaffold00951:17501-18385(-) / protein_length=201 / sequence_SO=supercontig / SO=protein_coding / is_pseudo=false
MDVLVHISTDNLGVSMLKISEFSEMAGAQMMAQGGNYEWLCEIFSEREKAKIEIKTRRSTLQTNRNDEGKGTANESDEAPQNEKATSSDGKKSIITFIYIMRSMGVNIEGLPNDQTEDEENNNQQDGNEEVDRHYHKDESREEGVGVGVGEGGEGSFEEGAIEDEIEEERQIGRQYMENENEPKREKRKELEMKMETKLK